MTKGKTLDAKSFVAKNPALVILVVMLLAFFTADPQLLLGL